VNPLASPSKVMDFLVRSGLRRPDSSLGHWRGRPPVRTWRRSLHGSKLRPNLKTAFNTRGLRHYGTVDAGVEKARQVLRPEGRLLKACRDYCEREGL
jgi:hypothetical protein